MFGIGALRDFIFTHFLPGNVPIKEILLITHPLFNSENIPKIQREKMLEKLKEILTTAASNRGTYVIVTWPNEKTREPNEVTKMLEQIPPYRRHETRDFDGNFAYIGYDTSLHAKLPRMNPQGVIVKAWSEYIEDCGDTNLWHLLKLFRENQIPIIDASVVGGHLRMVTSQGKYFGGRIDPNKRPQLITYLTDALGRRKVPVKISLNEGLHPDILQVLTHPKAQTGQLIETLEHRDVKSRDVKSILRPRPASFASRPPPTSLALRYTRKMRR